MRFKIKSSHVGHRNRLQHSEESCLTLVSSLGLVTNSHQRAAACSNKPPRTSQRHPSVCVGVFQCPLGQTTQQLRFGLFLTTIREQVRPCYVLCQSHDFCVAHSIAQRTVTDHPFRKGRNL